MKQYGICVLDYSNQYLSIKKSQLLEFFKNYDEVAINTFRRDNLKDD